jgi:hypothetical protein
MTQVPKAIAFDRKGWPFSLPIAGGGILAIGFADSGHEPHEPAFVQNALRGEYRRALALVSLRAGLAGVASVHEDPRELR